MKKIEEESKGINNFSSAVTSNLSIPARHYTLIAKYADEFLSGIAHRTIYAQTLMANMNDPCKAKTLPDFFILDIRKPEDYAIGHINGAVNIEYEYIAGPENLFVLPIDIPILVVCYTGHTSSMVTCILNMLGYDAWTLRFGMTGWRNASLVKVWSPLEPQTIYGAGYEEVK